MTLEQLKSAIYNNVVGGQMGDKYMPLISMEQIEDDIIDERLLIIKELGMKNMLPKNDLLMAINCIELDCESLDRCPCGKSYTKPLQHFEIPQIVNDFGDEAVEFIGSVDREVQFVVYTSTSYQMHKYKRRGANRPYVYIETVPNENNMYDCFVFNAPLLKRLSVIAVFKDPRQLEQFSCCVNEDTINYNFIDNDIKRRLTEKYKRYYGQPVLKAQQEAN